MVFERVRLALAELARHERVMRPAIAMIEPDIAGNVGTLLRTAACFGVTVHIAEPCGFPFADRSLRRAGMDYAARADIVRHADRHAFVAAMRAAGRRLVLLTTRGAERIDAMRFTPLDVLILGSEGSGAPDDMHDAADARLAIPLRPGFRSLNVATAGGIAISEALRQTTGYPQ
jgi:tRNA (cytidine/uridine-2'-O-)-methyltransferase